MSALAWPSGARELARSTVAASMHEGVFSCARDASLATVAELMASHSVHAVVVVDQPEDVHAVWGVISDLDLVAAASLRDLDEQTAGGTAATPVLTVGPEETLLRAAQLMTEHGAAHLIVVDPGGRPLGVISTLDVARVLAGPGA
jgi:CBS domain-containing protein